MKLTDYTDNTELTLLDKPAKATEHAIYLNQNIRNQLLATGAGRWGDTSVTTEEIVFYGKPSFVLRIQNRERNWVMILSKEVIPEFKRYLQGASHEVS